MPEQIHLSVSILVSKGLVTGPCCIRTRQVKSENGLGTAGSVFIDYHLRVQSIYLDAEESAAWTFS